MIAIRPITDLRNNFSEISKQVHETDEPIYLTKNGYGDMVVMSIEAFERIKNQAEIYLKLKESELESKLTSKRYTHEEVFGSLRESLKEWTEEDV